MRGKHFWKEKSGNKYIVIDWGISLKNKKKYGA